MRFFPYKQNGHLNIKERTRFLLPDSHREPCVTTDSGFKVKQSF